MDPVGVVMMVLGVVILYLTRDQASSQRGIEPGSLGRFSRRVVIAQGALIGVGAIVGGAIVAF